MSTPFAICLRGRVSYEQVRGNAFSKLDTLDQEGRSSAVTVLSKVDCAGVAEIAAERPRGRASMAAPREHGVPAPAGSPEDPLAPRRRRPLPSSKLHAWHSVTEAI